MLSWAPDKPVSTLLLTSSFRNMQVVPLDKQITVLDSPCFITSPHNSSAALALRSPASIEVLKPLEAASAILSQADSRQVVLKYTVPEYKDSLDFFTKLAQRRGLCQKGGNPNVEVAAKLIWSEWTGASLSYYCHPPTSWNPPPHLTESVTTNMKRGFNLEELEKNNAHSLQVLRSPHLANAVLFWSSGLTNGIIYEKDIPEELPRQRVNKLKSGDEDIIIDQENVDGDSNAEVSNMSSIEDTGEAVVEESTAGELPARSLILDGMTKEDDAYDFNTDYV